MAIAWSRQLDCSCYEVGHCWTPTCSGAFLSLTLDSFRSALRIYAVFYLVTGILRKKTKDKKVFLKKYVADVVRSSAFLALNASCYCSMICVFRRLLGSINYLGVGILPGVCASMIAILVERKARRGVLALYMFTVALETLYKMAAFRGAVKGPKYGEVLLFSVALAVYTYLYKKDSLPETSKSVLRYFIGNEEVTARPSYFETSQTDLSGRSYDKYLPHRLRLLWSYLRRTPKHSTCRHQFGCLTNCLESSLALFAVGYGCQAVFSLRRAVGVMLRKPRALLDALTHRDNFNLGMFLASLTATLKLSHCLLRWVRDKDSPLHGLVSGFLAGWTMMWYRSSTIALWVASKLLETVYFKGAATGKLPHSTHADVLLYALSCGFVIQAATLEPHNIRPGYWKFLLQLTNNKFAQMNRKILDGFGTHSSTLYPDYWPKYDRRYSVL